MKIVILFFLLFSTEIILSQNVVTYSNLSQTVTAESGQEVLVKVMASCTGSSSTSVLINPTYCVFDNGLTGVNFSNGTYLLPGQQSEITFKFRKATPLDHSFTYKFSTNSSCSQEDSKMISITVNYKKGATQETGLAKTTNINFVSYDNKIIVKWSKVPGALSYTLEYRKTGTPVTYGRTTSTETTKTIPDLLPNSLYQFWIRAEPYSESLDFPPYVSNNWELAEVYTESATPPSLDGSDKFCSTATSGYTQRYAIFYMPKYYNSINWTVEPSYAVLARPGTGNDLVISRASTVPFTIKAVIKIAGKEDLTFIKNVSNSCQLSALKNTDFVYPPSDLIVNSACSTSGGVCGTANFQWKSDNNTILHEVEYMILNYASNPASPVNGSFQTMESSHVAYNMYVNKDLQPWRIKFRVRSKSQNGTWSDFSQWSANFAW